MKQELEKRVSKLEAAQEQLMDEYESRQEILREQQMIKRSELLQLLSICAKQATAGVPWMQGGFQRHQQQY